jgi:hypothetical protein
VSATANFIKLPKSAIEGLKAIATAKISGTSGNADGYYRYLRQHGREVSDYRWSGLVLATLLGYLQQKKGIDLMKSEYDQIATDLTKARDATHFIFTESHKLRFLNEVNPQLFSEVEMHDFFNEFNETSDQQIGIAMLDGVIALQVALGALDDESVMVFSIT